MQQYLDLLKHIKENGEYKSPARDNMPSTKSIFGYQMRFDLSKGFPIVTTKKVSFKNIAIELLWFLRGDTNIKYLIDNGCNIWNEDAYNYMKKVMKTFKGNPEDIMNRNSDGAVPLTFEGFIETIKNIDKYPKHPQIGDYKLGDCGYQYGKVWRDWEKFRFNEDSFNINEDKGVDQISNLIKSLKETPESRRHILTSIDPANADNLALFWCHALAQFNCRLLTGAEREEICVNNKYKSDLTFHEIMEFHGHNSEEFEIYCDKQGIPKYKLDCHLYQRSADVFLGVPYNISSYALLTHILAEICNMQVGEFVHTFGDVHIYDNHENQVEEQLKREPLTLPKLIFSDNFNIGIGNYDEKMHPYQHNFDSFINSLSFEDFKLENYQHHPAIKADLSTGLK